MALGGLDLRRDTAAIAARDFRSGLPHPSADEREERRVSEPLIRPVSEASLGSLCAVAGVVCLLVAWCLLDNWNEVVLHALFKVGVADGTAEDHGEVNYYDGPITLSFLQFLFMGLAFAAIWAGTAHDHQQQLAKVRESIFNAPWAALVVSHVFCNFWLHSLVMPPQVMSLGVFAVSRASEVPIVAVARSRVLGQPIDNHSWRIIACTFAANMMLFYSYVQMEGCVCIWSGHGFFLMGLPLYVVFFLLVALPGANAICQEKMMAQWCLNPFLMLALQNILACALFAPLLLLENVRRSMRMMVAYQEIGLLVLWLCIQATVIAIVSVMLLRHLNAFWTIALRSLRVVYWWCLQLATFYASTRSLLSVSHPKVSGWSFGMLAGISLTVAALSADRRRVTAAGAGKGGHVADALREPHQILGAVTKEV